MHPAFIRRISQHLQVPSVGTKAHCQTFVSQRAGPPPDVMRASCFVQSGTLHCNPILDGCVGAGLGKAAMAHVFFGGGGSGG